MRNRIKCRETLMFSIFFPDVTARVSTVWSLCPRVGSSADRWRARRARAQLQCTWVQAPARASCFSMTSVSCAEWEPTRASTCKTVFEGWSYEEVLRCQTSVPSITLKWQRWLYSRARAVNKLKSSHGCALLALSSPLALVPVWTMKERS